MEIICINGLYQPAISWNPLLERLAPDVAAHTFDCPGQGTLSDKTEFTYADHLKTLATKFDLLGHDLSNVTVLALSSGCNLVVDYLHASEKKVGRLILCSPMTSSLKIHMKLVHGSFKRLLTNHGIDAFVESAMYGWYSPQFFSQFREPAQIVIRKRYQEAYGKNPETLLKLFEVGNSINAVEIDVIKKVSSKCEVILGSCDMLFPGRIIERDLRGMPISFVEGGHSFPLEAPAQVAEIVGINNKFN